MCNLREAQNGMYRFARDEKGCTADRRQVTQLAVSAILASKSGRQDLNLRPLGPEPSALARLSHAPKACSNSRHRFSDDAETVSVSVSYGGSTAVLDPFCVSSSTSGVRRKVQTTGMAAGSLVIFMACP